jgi:hypothetical protein
MSDANQIKSDIEHTRAELAQTVDALSAKLDVKAQAGQRAHEMQARAAHAYGSAKASAPPPVRHAWDRAEVATQPVVVKAKEDPKRAALVLGGGLLALLVLLRTRRAAKNRARARAC